MLLNCKGSCQIGDNDKNCSKCSTNYFKDKLINKCVLALNCTNK